MKRIAFAFVVLFALTTAAKSHTVEDQAVTMNSLIIKVEKLQAEMVRLKYELADVQDEVEESNDSPFLRAPRVVTDQ